MEYQNNAAGVTTITGLDDYLITGTLDQHGPMNGVLVNGTRYAYYAKYADIANGTDYETGQGTWSGDNTLSRDTITTSSNAGNSVNWGSGQKAIYIVADAELSTDMEQMVEGATKKILTASERSNIATMKSKVDLITITQAADLDQMVIDIGGALMDSEVTSLTGVKTLVIPDNTAVTAHGKDIVGAAAAANSRAVIGLGNSSTLNIGTTSGTVAAGDDARFGSVDIDDLTPATSIDGTELFPAVQGVAPVSVTAQQIAGNPLTAAMSHGRDLRQGFTDFSGMAITGSLADGAPLGVEKFLVCKDSAGAVTSGAGVIFQTSAVLETGTSASGRAGIMHTLYPQFFLLTGRQVDQRIRVLVGLLPTLTENYTLQFGFRTDAPSYMSAVAPIGIYIELTGASNNWFLCVKDGGGTTRIDSGVAAIANTAVTLRVMHDDAAAKSRFWIDGVEQASILDSTRDIGVQVLGMSLGIWKTAGTSARSCIAMLHAYELQSVATVGF